MPSPTLTRAVLIALLVFLLDRASKVWIVEVLDLRSRMVIEPPVPFLTLTMAWNEGINFGLFDFGAAGRWLLVALALGIVAAIVVWLRRGHGWGPAVGGGLIIGGALGNVWDRVQYGAVADFLNVACCGIANPFAFNVADTAIFVGVVIIFVFAREPAGRDARPGATGRDGPGGVR